MKVGIERGRDLHDKDGEEVVFVEAVSEHLGESDDDVEAHVVDEAEHEHCQVVHAFVLVVMLGLHEHA